MHIEDRHFTLIKNILKKYPYTFYAFGSRVTGKQKPLSDLDLLYFDNIPSLELSYLQEDFEESDLPFTVDIVNWNNCDTEFQNSIAVLEIVQEITPPPSSITEKIIKG